MPVYNGEVGYYWMPHSRYVKAGFSIGSEPLGRDYGAAIVRAVFLNRHLDAWRTGLNQVVGRLNVGSIAWLFAVFFKSSSYKNRVSERSSLVISPQSNGF